MSGKNISKETLRQSVSRRMNHMMVQILDQFDRKFAQSDEGNLYKFNIKNVFNDAIRANDRELMDYDIEYRPLRFNPDNTISVTRTLIESIEKIEFLPLPGIRITVSPDRLKILESIRYEFGAGLIYALPTNAVIQQIVFEINGLDNCVNLVIPFMDKYKLIAKVQEQYLQWRDLIVRQYSTRR